MSVFWPGHGITHIQWTQIPTHPTPHTTPPKGRSSSLHEWILNLSLYQNLPTQAHYNYIYFCSLATICVRSAVMAHAHKHIDNCNQCGSSGQSNPISLTINTLFHNPKWLFLDRNSFTHNIAETWNNLIMTHAESVCKLVVCKFMQIRSLYVVPGWTTPISLS